MGSRGTVRRSLTLHVKAELERYGTAGNYMLKLVALLVLVAAIFFGYERKLHTPLMTSLTPTLQTYQSPSFFTLADWEYNLDIGIPSVPTDEATCLEVRPKTGVAGKPLVFPAKQSCRALIPPMGATDWVVKEASSNRVVAAFSTPGHGLDWPRPSEVAMAWYRMGYFKAKAGSRYVIVLTLHDPQLPGDRYRPLLRANSPPSWP